MGQSILGRKKEKHKGRGKLGRGVEIAASSKSRPARSWRVAVLLTEPHGARSIGRTRSSKVTWSRGRGARGPVPLKTTEWGELARPRVLSSRQLVDEIF